MAGYHGYSKSNNAIQAEKEGKFPASVVAKKLKIPTALVKEMLRPCEWHHTSKWYNSTDYYDLDSAQGFLESAEGSVALAEFKSRAKQAREQVYENCEVAWLEWVGSRRRPRAKEHAAKKARVVVKGQSAMVTLATGETFRKRLDTNGFSFAPDRNETANSHARQ